jgi:hypothetical protein
MPVRQSLQVCTLTLATLEEWHITCDVLGTKVTVTTKSYCGHDGKGCAPKLKSKEGALLVNGLPFAPGGGPEQK